MAARGRIQAGGTQTYAQDTKIFALRRVIVRLGSVLWIRGMRVPQFLQTAGDRL